MAEYQRRDARLRIHHVAIGQLNADSFRLQQPEQLLLIAQFRAGRIAERNTNAVVFGIEQLLQAERRIVNDAP